MRISKHPDIEDVVLVRSDEPGPRIVTFSGVHGDEVSGIHAIEKLLFDFFGGRTLLTRDSVTLVRANREAMRAERRYAAQPQPHVPEGLPAGNRPRVL